MNRTIFLIGPMASGKSAVGAELARLLGTEALDTDALVVQQHGPVPEIFANLGETAFRGFETEALRRAAETLPDAGSAAQGNAVQSNSVQSNAAQGDPGPLIVATGGGAVLAEENRRLLSEGFTVYLFTDAQTVAHRIAADTTRPLLAGGASSGETPDRETSPAASGDVPSQAADALEAWSRIFADRAALYEECADFRIDTRKLSPVHIAEAIVTAYRDAGH